MAKIQNFRDEDTPLIMDFCQKEDPFFVNLDTSKTRTEFERLVLKRDPWESSFDPNGCFLASEGKKLIGFAKAHINKRFVEAHGMDVGFISPGWPWSRISLTVHHCYRGEGLQLEHRA